ncbi:MAG: hypothetical protein KF799_07375 [Bdellovibrionales bacterium]|nr:hypothetical protein [Bdellovibrionales bacterium]
MRVFVLIAAALFSSSVFASKARVNSLQGANHLVDTQTVFTAPSHMLLLSPFLTYEMGAAGAGAEGGIMRSLSNGSKLLVYLGHQNTTAFNGLADIRTAQGYVSQNNPIEVLYGMNNMAFGASLSMLDNKTNKTKETGVILKWGMNFGDDWVYAHVHAISTAQEVNGTSTDKLNAGPYFKVGGSHAMDNMRVFGELNIGSGKDEVSSVKSNISDTAATVGIEDRSLKTDTADIYYGIRANYYERKTGDAKASGYNLPAFMGIEYTATTWAVVRASVSQNILLGQTKTTTAATPPVTTEAGIANDTAVSAGLGLKWNNMVLDGSLTAASNGNINGNQFLSQASLTYTF